MPAKVVSFAERNLFDISGERNPTLRRKAVKRLWGAGGVVFVDAEGAVNGRREIGKAAGMLLIRYPEYEFWTLKAEDCIPGVCRLFWAFGTAGLSPALTGVDVVRVETRRIVAVYRFVNGAAF